MPAKKFDVTGKDILEAFPESLPALLGSWSYQSVEIVDSDISTVTGAADKAIMVHGDSFKWILNFEAQASHKLDIPDRLQVQSVLLGKRHRVPVHSAVILLRREANASNLTGMLVEQFPGEALPYATFRYQVLRLWEEPLEKLLTGSLGWLPLAPLTDEAAGRLPEVIERVEARLRREAEPARADLLRASTFILLGLRYPSDLIEELYRGVTSMEESTTYQAIIEKGEKKGAKLGELKGVRETLLELGKDRLGKPNSTIKAQVESITDLKRLKKLVQRAHHASSWHELLESIT